MISQVIQSPIIKVIKRSIPKIGIRFLGKKTKIPNTLNKKKKKNNALVAQQAEAVALKAIQWEFESLQGYQIGFIAQWQSTRSTCDRRRLESFWNHQAPVYPPATSRIKEFQKILMCQKDSTEVENKCPCSSVVKSATLRTLRSEVKVLLRVPNL